MTTVGGPGQVGDSFKTLSAIRTCVNVGSDRAGRADRVNAFGDEDVF